LRIPPYYGPLMRPFASVSALVFAVACQSAVQPVVMPSVYATVARADVPVGQTLTVAVTLTNDTSLPIEVPVPMAFIEVRDATGRVVAFGRFGMMSMIALPNRRLEPGATATDRLLWAGELTSTTSLAPIGTYSVRAVVPVRGGVNAFAYSPSATVVLTP
jgi:hypothetical protein